MRIVTTAPGDHPPTRRDLPKAPDVAKAAADTRATPSPTRGWRSGRDGRDEDTPLRLLDAMTAGVPISTCSAMTVLVTPVDGQEPPADVITKTD
jgi:hypothetical protein